MSSWSTLKYAAIAATLSAVLLTGTALGKPADTTFYRAFYLEHEGGDFEAAAELYAQALRSGLPPALEAQARAGLAACREEIACADFARLMPEDTWVYLEINRPGDQLGDLLGMLGLLAPSIGEDRTAAPSDEPGRRFAISPVLIRELLGIRGAAAALTGVNLKTQMPVGVAVFHPGSVDVIRGVLDSALPAAAEAVKPIQGHATYKVEDTVFVCLTSRLVVVSPQRHEIVAVLRRLEGKTDKSLATSERWADVLSQREASVVVFCVNTEPIIPMLTGLAGASRELALVNAVLDFGSLHWIAGRAGVNESGLFVDLAVCLEEGQHNLVYNCMRTPPITRDTLACVPKGVAGFVAAALGDAPTDPRRLTRAAAEDAPPIIGLDFGREIFANIVDFAVYAVPPASDGGSAGPVPDVAAVIRVRVPAKSQALWTQILGIASMAAGAPTTDGTTERIGDAEVQAYKFPDGVTIRFATIDDKILVASTQHAMGQAVEALNDPSTSVLSDEVFAPSLARMTDHTSKAVFVHPGRCFEIARKFMGPEEIREAEPLVGMLTDLVASALSDEAEDLFRVSATVTGLPDVGEFVAVLIEREMRIERLHDELRHARRVRDWSGALTAVDALIGSDPDNLRYRRDRFDILATGLKDREAAMTCGRDYLKRCGKNAAALNRLAWALLTEERYGWRYHDFAADLAERACELTGRRQWRILDTLALAKFETGDVTAAIELQQRVVEMRGGDREDTRRRLDRYLAASENSAVANAGAH